MSLCCLLFDLSRGSQTLWDRAILERVRGVLASSLILAGAPIYLPIYLCIYRSLLSVSTTSTSIETVGDFSTFVFVARTR